MKTIKYGNVLFGLVLLLVQTGFAARYTVCKSGECNFKTIQAAIDAASVEDEVVIMDDGVYAEQVTIDSTKSGLILRSENPQTGPKPTIKYKDVTNVGPRDADEALIDSMINFDRNGALRVIKAATVRIEGIIVDGGGVNPFGYDAVWEGRYALQHGNAAITLWIAGDVIVRDCEMQNAYIGVNVKDRNEGGVFANPNPADISPENIIPFSRFARTGNHLFEYNRIHDNSVGMFFESTWDLGSTLRYNLFYENHHPTAAVANKVKGLTSEGGNQCGGALMFKDQMLSPLAIYNNTFWHNSLIFVGNWKSGGQHLIFNNIFAEPNEYFADATTSFSQSFEMSKCFANRMHNCVYAAMQQAPTTNYTTITNDLKVPSNANEGALITPFPATAEVRWVETAFESTDPDDPLFLTPKMSDYILDKGWEASGVKDPDGSRADLGAIPLGGGRSKDIVTIRPTTPVEITGSTAKISFNATPRLDEGMDIKSPVIVYLYAVTKLDTGDVFGSAYKAIPATNISKIAIPAKQIIIGDNVIEVAVPGGGTGDFAFFEMIIEATGSDGRPFTSSVGFIPYRKLEYLLDVVVKDKVGGTAITTVRAGQEVVLEVKARKGSAAFTNKVDPTEVFLQSRFALRNPAGDSVTNIPGGISGTATTPVVFTRVPSGGVEYVHVAGKWINVDKVVAFLGSSQGVTVLAGPPDSILFQKPASGMKDIINPGTTELVKVRAYDKYGNPVDTAYPITVVSLQPDIGKITDTTQMTKDDGISIHHALVTNGDKGEIFTIVASLKNSAGSLEYDTAYFEVGLPRDRLWIFYGDTAAYDPAASISACAGVRVPVTIRASKDGKVISMERATTFTINLDQGLAAYATATSAEKVLTGALVKGEAKIWITATGRNVTNGSIRLTSGEGDVVGGERSGINFNSCYATPLRGAYFTTNGRGAVDQVKIYYDQDLEATEIPDSIVFFWPSVTGQNRIAKKLDVAIDPTVKSMLVVTLPMPFNDGITRYTESSSGLGNAYWLNPLTPDAQTMQFPFDIADSVGPLIATATLIERLVAGNDSIILTFTESVPYETVKENGLTLLKKQADGSFVPIALDIVKAEPNTDGATVVTIKYKGDENAPKDGDSIRITPAGPVVDASGNKAHPLNRAVALTTQKIAPDIVSAKYEDRNADGKIETVQMVFNKPVTRGEMRMQFKFESTMSTGGADSSEFTVVGPATIDVNIAGLFNENTLKDKTSGTLNVTVSFENYEVNNVKSRMATDGAAPVLTALGYHYGRFTEATGAESDTVFATFSEALKTPPQITRPYLFITATGTQYTVDLTYLGTAGARYKYQVTKLQDGFHPAELDPVTKAPGDSAWINVEANATDNMDNVQANDKNKRVAITVNQPPFELNLKVGPNPFNPRTSNVRISMKAMTEVAIPTRFVVNAVVYDKVGNVVKMIPGDVETVCNGTIKGEFIEANDSCIICWDGTNRQGRVVGIGTYLVMVNARYTTEGTETIADNRTIPIGVKPE